MEKRAPMPAALALIRHHVGVFGNMISRKYARRIYPKNGTKKREALTHE
jgi:hypothetical protein